MKYISTLFYLNVYHKKVLKPFNLLITAWLILVALSYQYHNEEELYPACEVTENISFSNHILPLVQMECATAGCHVTGTGRVVLTEYTQIKGVAEDGRLRHLAITSRSMPPERPLTNCQVELIRIWIEEGALNN